MVEQYDVDGSGCLEFAEFAALMDEQRAWNKARDDTRNRDYWYNSLTKQRTWADPGDPEQARQNTVVQKFVELLKEQGLGAEVVSEAGLHNVGADNEMTPQNSPSQNGAFGSRGDIAASANPISTTVSYPKFWSLGRKYLRCLTMTRADPSQWKSSQRASSRSSWRSRTRM